MTDLTPHLRQYMHNDGSGFVAGYDCDGIERVVAGLDAEIERLRKIEAEYQSMCAEQSAPLTCDYCGTAINHHPWHGSEGMNRHIHACNSCRHKLPDAERDQLKAMALRLCDAVENMDELPPTKYALKCGRLVNQIRQQATAEGVKS
ncbi:hypothetical protein [Marinobacterium litorale]|uniref:hypothetical protein n=1 Tax=Marinobacterium litorale TaxID=404770 RepID=UPI00048464E7|nr:hypothetical protein [Marinobacterium litorale]